MKKINLHIKNIIIIYFVMMEEVKKKQNIASNPDYSIWTSASAGSGKTTVLVKRLLRMLLSGIQPSKILCITFTNTGAAEMRNRINAKLAEWTTLNDEKLEKEIFELDGDYTNIKEKTKIARTLFAKILDYSNDFKILTIHSFCQQIIKRFPLEANIIPNFQIADEVISSELLLQAKDELLKIDNSEVKRSIEYIFTYENEEQFVALLKQAMGQKDNLLYLKSKFFTTDGVINEIKKSFDLEFEENSESIENEFLENLDLSILNDDLLDSVESSGKVTDLKFISFFKNKFDLTKYIYLFLTQKNEIKAEGKIITKNIVENFPQLADFVEREGRRVFEFVERRNNLINFEFTAHFLRLVYCIFDIYTALKKDAGYLDYSDLIFETDRLLNDSRYKNLNGENPYSNWINYKLDEGIDHLLIDEAQDTSPIQWDIVKSITEEFFAGYGYKENENRTIFVVGDEKQSIFSFQGADPNNFHIILEDYKQKIENCGKKFENIYLETSFRSLKSILSVADEVFKEPSRKNAISKLQDTIKHNIVRQDGVGKVEIWPLIGDKTTKQEKNEELPNWEINYPENIEPTNKQKLAEIIAKEVNSWFKNGKIIFSRKDKCFRPLRYSDIMILIKNRDKDFINYLIRQFSKYNIPTMGNDRFNLSENIISQDIISLCKFVLFNEDDLSLANIIKSPILNMSEDDLYKLCKYKNENNCSLWIAFSNCDFLNDLIEKVQILTPYEFLFYVFETKNIRKNFKERFVYLADEVLNEILNLVNDYEKNHNDATLLGFIEFLENSDLEIKRDIDLSTDEIKIITVHSSKGMESPIIILADTNHTKGKIQKTSSILNHKIEGYDFKLPILVKEKTNFTENTIKEQMQSEAEEEYLRLLYVAITRAENELYICDYGRGQQEAKENCWYEILKQSIINIGAKNRKSENFEENILYIGDEDKFDKTAKINIKKMENQENIGSIILTISQSKTQKEESKIINPSLYYAENVIVKPHENSDNIQKGKLVHKLLEILPEVKDSERDKIADIYLKDSHYKNEIKEIVFNVLNNKEFQYLFGENSKAEVPIFGNIGKDIISGQIDRLTITNDKIFIIDYKNTNYLPTKVPEKYKKQLGLYKILIEKIYSNKIVECYILWTSFGKIDKIDLK
ncbi:MAG: double-strand break repair helicase AddA [Rickettsiales bacterium]|nr:double-strand break repair helicase AddA [Rickettsiales bacterium]